MPAGAPEEAFPGHAVLTVTESGWRTSKDSALLSFAQARFDVFVTVDGNLQKQHDLSRSRLGFVVARVPNNRLESFGPILEDLRTAIENVRPGEVVHVVLSARTH